MSSQPNSLSDLPEEAIKLASSARAERFWTEEEKTLVRSLTEKQRVAFSDLLKGARVATLNYWCEVDSTKQLSAKDREMIEQEIEDEYQRRRKKD